MALEQELLQIENALWLGGPQAYERHCDNECLVAFDSMAGVMKRADIAGTAEVGRWSDVRMTPKAVLQPTADTAFIAYACAAQRRNGEAYTAIVSSAYVRRADGWKLAAHSQTPTSQA